MPLALIVLAVLVVFGLVVVSQSVVTVEQGYEVMMERFGKYVATLKPGLQFVVPFVYRVGRRMNMMEHAVEIPSQEVITKDNATVTVDAIVFLVIVDAYKAAYNVADYVGTCQQLTLANVRSVIGLREFDLVLAERIKMNDEILQELDVACSTWGIKVTRVEIRDIRPPADLLAAMGEQKKADQEKRAKILAAEGDQQAQIKVAEGKRQAAILESQGKLEAAKNEAEAIKITAQAQADATKSVAESIQGHGEAAVNYFLGQKYIEAMAQINPNAKIVMIPADFGSGVASIGGIAALLGGDSGKTWNQAGK
ncbi:MAG TPA: SPFH domain-containing protein [bacterium]|jgi:regulator of protease activity HflC (stomatin/prohibitin superfamily)|nr:SPFH domain-containing protein [bacterium]